MIVDRKQRLFTRGNLASLLVCAAMPLFGQGCSPRPPAMSAGEPPAMNASEDTGLAAALEGVNLDVALEIHKQYLALERAADGTTGADFGVACAFFERLTGEETNVDMQYVGALPTDKTREDMRRIRAWVKSNAGNLFWDKKQGSVGVARPGA